MGVRTFQSDMWVVAYAKGGRGRKSEKEASENRLVANLEMGNACFRFW